MKRKQITITTNPANGGVLVQRNFDEGAARMAAHAMAYLVFEDVTDEQCHPDHRDAQIENLAEYLDRCAKFFVGDRQNPSSATWILDKPLLIDSSNAWLPKVQILKDGH